MKIFEFQNFGKKYPYEKFELLKSLNFSVNENETIGVVCEKQSGKSTIAKTIAGLVLPTSGEVLYHEKPLAQTEFCDRQIAVIFEDFALMSGKSVLQNILFPLKVRKVEKAVAESLALEALKKFELIGESKTKAKDLSKVDKLKTALARVSTRNFDLIVFDDVFKSVPKSETQKWVGLATQNKNCAKIFISSEIEDLSLCSKIFVICEYETGFFGSFDETIQYIESTSCFKKYERGEN